MKKILDIGCGKSKTDGAVGVDKFKLEGVDIIYDIEILPLPFKGNCIDKIICNSVLEHVTNLVSIMEEFFRILKPGGLLVVNVPHGYSTNYITDPTHKRPFGVRTMEYFTEEGPLSYYSKAHFEILERKVILSGLGRHEWVYSWLLRMLTYLFNKNVDFAEHFFKYVPFDAELRFVLKKQENKNGII